MRPRWSRNFVAKLEKLRGNNTSFRWFSFAKGQRKRRGDGRASCANSSAEEGRWSLSARRRRRSGKSPTTGRALPPGSYARPAMVNHYYVYAVDRDFGPFFLKFCSYFPLQCQAVPERPRIRQNANSPRKVIAFEALDNGVLNCADPERLQKICDRPLGTQESMPCWRKWLALCCPNPFTGVDRQGRFTATTSRSCRPSFSLTQVLVSTSARPPVLRTGNPRENLDLGRPAGSPTDLQSQDHPQDAGAVFVPGS